MKTNVLLLIALIGTTLNGCASYKINNLEAYQKVPLQQGEHMPSKAELSGIKSRVVILELEDSKWHGAGEAVSNQVNKKLNETNNVLIVDRSLASKLKQEIQLAESQGRTDFKGQDVADFAFSGKITDATTLVKFTESSSWKDKEGKIHIEPAKCTTSARVAYTLTIVRLPSLDVIKTIDADGSASSTQNAQWNRACQKPSKDESDAIISAAISNAIRESQAEIKNPFAPVGYILERRTFEKNNIFKTTLGINSGAKAGLSAEVIREVTEQNVLTGTVSKEQIKIADGEISDQLGTGFSFLIISDQDKSGKILLGDKVQVKY